MRLAELLTAGRVTTSLSGTTKDDVLVTLAELLAFEAGVDASEITRVLAEREALASTGVGSGVAIPHGRLPGIERMHAALAIHPVGVPFDAVDGQPAHIFVALLAPDRQASAHLRALARISRLMRQARFRELLRQATGPEEALARVVEGEAALDAQ